MAKTGSIAGPGIPIVVGCVALFFTTDATRPPLPFALCGLTPTFLHSPPALHFLPVVFARKKMSSHDNDELIDYEDENDVVPNGATLTAGGGATDDDKEKKNFSGIHSTGFRLVILFGFFLLFLLTIIK